MSKITHFGVTPKMRKRMIYFRPRIGKTIGTDFSTGIKLESNEQLNGWSVDDNPTKTLLLSSLRVKLDQAYAQMLGRSEPVITPDLVRKEAFRDTNLDITQPRIPNFPQMLLDVQKRNQELAQSNQMTRGAANKYITYSKHLTQYVMQTFGYMNVELSDIMKPSFIGQYRHWLLTKQPDPQSLEYSRRNCTFLKALSREAYNNGYTNRDSFAGYKMAHEKKKIDYLSVDEIKKLYAVTLPTPNLECQRDAFLFQMYSALAYIDLSMLRPSDIQYDENNEAFISKSRYKSEEPYFVPLIPEAVAILNKYRRNPYCLKNNLCLPVISNQKMNKALGEISLLAYGSKRLTSHLGRKTAATMMLNAGVAVTNVQRLLGHAKLETTLRYYAAVINATVMDDVKRAYAGRTFVNV